MEVASLYVNDRLLPEKIAGRFLIFDHAENCFYLGNFCVGTLWEWRKDPDAFIKNAEMRYKHKLALAENAFTPIEMTNGMQPIGKITYGARGAIADAKIADEVDSILKSLMAQPFDAQPLVLAMQSSTCPDCKGTGVYVGLNCTEPCRACGGVV